MMRTHRLMFAFLAFVACATGEAYSSFAALQTNVVERHYDRFGRQIGISLFQRGRNCGIMSHKSYQEECNDEI